MFDSIPMVDTGDLSVEPKNVEVSVGPEGLKGTRIALVVEKELSEDHIRKISHGNLENSQFVATGSVKDKIEEEISRLLSKYDTYKDSTKFLFSLAELYSLIGDYQSAFEFSHQATLILQDEHILERHGDFCVLSGRTDEAKDIFLELSNKGQIYSTLRLVQFEVEANNLGNATTLVNRALDKDFLDWRVQLLAGTLHLVRNELYKAIHAYRLALEEKNNSSSIYLKLGFCYHLLNLPEKALSNLRKSILLNNSNTDSLNLYADISLENNLKIDQACKYLEYELGEHPDNRVILDKLGKIYFETSQIKKGVNLLSQATKKYDDTRAWNNLGAIQSKRSSKSSIPNYYKAIEKSGGLDKVYDNSSAELAVVNLCSSLINNKEYSEARNIALTYINNCPDERYLTKDPLYKIYSIFVHSLISENKPYDAAKIAIEILKKDYIHLKLILEFSTFLTTYFSLTGHQSDLMVANKYAKYVYGKLNEHHDDLSDFYNLIINNYAFVSIELGNYELAKDLLGQINYNLDNMSLIRATNALYEMKIGNLEKAERLYNLSILRTTDQIKKEAIKLKYTLEFSKYLIGQGQTQKARRKLNTIMKSKLVKDWMIKFLRDEANTILKNLTP